MDILIYSEEQRQFRKRLRSFLEKEVIPFADQWEKDGIVPKSAWRKMGENGFLCTGVDRKFGGLGGDFRYSVIVAEELAKTRQTGLSATLHSDVVVPYIESYGSPAIKEKYLPDCVSGRIITAIAMTEPDAGSDLAAISTTAVEDGEMVLISGAKTFISNGINADLVIVAARAPETDDPYQALSLYVVESGTPGFTRGRRLSKMGFHSQDTAELFFSNCRIPKDNRLGQKGQGFFMLVEKLQQERLATAVAAQPAAELILEATMTYCKNTVVSGKPLSKRQSVQHALVEMAAEVKVGRTFIDKLVMDHVEGQTIIVETAMAKFWTTEMLRRVSDRCLDLFGQFGMLESCPIVRGFRDIRVLSIFAGTNEIMRNIAAKFMGL